MENKNKYIESLFIPCELSIRLRDLGFNLPCLATYRSGSLYSHLTGYLDDGNWDEHLSMGDENQWVSAPTWEQAFQWIEKNNDKFKADSISLNHNLSFETKKRYLDSVIDICEENYNH